MGDVLCILHYSLFFVGVLLNRFLGQKCPSIISNSITFYKGFHAPAQPRKGLFIEIFSIA